MYQKNLITLLEMQDFRGKPHLTKDVMLVVWNFRKCHWKSVC